MSWESRIRYLTLCSIFHPVGQLDAIPHGEGAQRPVYPNFPNDCCH